jgi:NTE family protein
MTRRGIVLGGGGVLGGTWAVGALCALEERLGIRANDADVIVGTSAGSVIASMLGCGVTPTQLKQHYRGEEITEGPLAGYEWDPSTATGGPRPTRPRALAPGSFKLIGQSVLHPGQLPATAVLSAFLPTGGRSLGKVGELVDAVTDGGQWTTHPGTWVVAMDYETGKRVVFGRSGAPVAKLSDAVMASCAIPGWFSPVRIGSHTYVDGGTISATSIDVVAYAGLDEVYVVAPMVSFEHDHPTTVAAKLERKWREQVTKAAVAEVVEVERTGARVYLVGPGPQDLEAMGGNLMDATRLDDVLETSLRTSAAVWSELLD